MACWHPVSECLSLAMKHTSVVVFQEQGLWASLGVSGPQGRYGLGDFYCFLDDLRFHSDHACGRALCLCSGHPQLFLGLIAPTQVDNY